ncbi:MAG: VWA domain-containing protein [Candidatus Heimdallarchaeota archaeon]|nr:MAG: VWA domain-containing protein [Candidatus Heimdallarchaeota archaeon]
MEGTKIGKKIIVTFLGTIIIGVLVIVGFSSIATIIFSSAAADEAAEITLDEELLNLNRLARDKSSLVKSYFEEIATEITFLANYAEDLFNGRIPIQPRPSYYGETTVESTTPPEFDAETGRSYYASAWYIPEFHPDLNPLSSLNNKIWSLVDISSNLDHAFKTVYTANPVYITFYLGFEYHGIFRTYPYKNLDHYPTKEYDDCRTQTPTVGYDPRARPWYCNGKEAGSVAFTVPYLFATGDELGVTATMPVEYDNGTLIGIMGADLTIGSIENSILGLQILNSGYAFLIDTDGITNVHPDMDITEDPPVITVLEPIPNSILTKMTNLNDGQESYRKNNQLWYITYYPVDVSETSKYSLAIVVQESAILADANLIRSQTLFALIMQTTIFLIIVGVVGVIMFFGVRVISKRIVEPITELIDVTDQIAKGNLNRTLEGRMGGAREIVVLYDTFRGLLTALRFGNEEYYAGNLAKAMANYNSALELFTTLDNIKGIGICHNNIGNIHNARKNYQEAELSYKKAIEIGESLLAKFKETDERAEHSIALASRNNNLGMMYKSIDRLGEAEKSLNKALEFDKSIDNVRGFAVRYGNLGQIYLAQNRIDDAKGAIEESYEIAQSLGSERAIAYAMMNKGTYYYIIEDLEKAKEFFSNAIERAESLDIRVSRTSLLNLQEIYERENNKLKLAEVEDKLKELTSRVSATRELIFVLDYSGSMAGTRIRDARKGIVNIFFNQVRDVDYVSLIIFDSQVRLVYRLAMKKDAKDFVEQVKRLKSPNYTTAMYDAIGMAYQSIMARKSGIESWIIVLTDGDDNASKKFTPNSVNKIVKSVDANLVIIGVGDLKDRDKLKNMCKSSARGKYIEIEAGVSGAITEAFEEVSLMLAEFEVEGFVTDY